jgi:hypothetical protein
MELMSVHSDRCDDKGRTRSLGTEEMCLMCLLGLGKAGKGSEGGGGWEVEGREWTWLRVCVCVFLIGNFF